MFIMKLSGLIIVVKYYVCTSLYIGQVSWADNDHAATPGITLVL